jgi:hypothetical protein
MSVDDGVRIGLLSDGPLYDEAVRFAAGKRLRPAQINGLLSFSGGSWAELERFVNHQAGRNWPTLPGGEDHPTKMFYKEMKAKLTWLRQQTPVWGFVPEGLTKQQTRDRTDAVAIRLAAEFIQHLTAEMLYSEGGR